MENYINRIAKIEKQERFNAIINVLKENGINYKIQPIPNYNSALGNILVEFNPEKGNKVVVSAHYDNAPGTPGANDNAAACSILLNLIISLKDTKSHLEFAFFDLEECVFVGSAHYLTMNSGIDLAINMDMCGLGSNIVIEPTGDIPASLYQDYQCTIINNMPLSDAVSFVSKGIPTICVVNSTDRDLNWYKCRYGIPDFIKTMHTPKDTVDTVNLSQVEVIYNFVKDAVERFFE